MAILKNERDLVVPGEILAEGLDYLPGYGAFREGDKILAKNVGMVSIHERNIGVNALAGVYMPKAGDKVIAEVLDVQMSTWFLDISAPYDASLSIGEASEEYVERGADLSRIIDVGDLLYAKIVSVSKYKNIQLTMKDVMCKKLRGGKIVSITPSKVPRLIGKAGSMISMIKEKTGCNIVIGQNGRVWIKGENEDLATQAVAMVNEKSHLDGLTNTITEFLNANSSVKTDKPYEYVEGSENNEG
ncbi:MAG: RNA-binding protein [Candidatus Aenigmarchaeota archaeon]|nr:RNA-binding protein [Candidatus Aenigmarchaeota archaeon]